MSIEGKDNVLDLAKDEKLKVQLEIRKLASELKKEVTNTSSKKTEAIAKMDKNFDKLIHTGIVEEKTLDTIKNETLTDYVEATSDKTKNTGWVETATKPVIDQTIDDTNKLKIKETTVSTTDGSLISPQDTPDGSAARLKAVKEKAVTDKKIDLEKSIDASLTTIDGLAEAEYLQWKPDKKMTQTEADIAFTGFASNVAHEIDNQLLTVQEQAVMWYRFQVLDLKNIIKDGEKNNNQSESGNNEAGSSSYLDNIGSSLDIKELKQTHLVKYPNLEYQGAWDKYKPENIYEDTRMPKVMKKLLHSDLSNGTFGVNLSKENGFAWIVDFISQNLNASETKKDWYNFVVENNKLKIIVWTDAPRDIAKKDLLAMKQEGLIKYKQEKWFLQFLDDEMGKMTTILNAVEWKDLQAFSDLAGVRSAEYNTIKETVNTNEIHIDDQNVFKVLCDRNGDLVLSADGSRKFNRQKNIGDVWNVFGQQVYFTIDQAIKVQNVLHGDAEDKAGGKGEQIVIQNITRAISTENARARETLKGYDDLTQCTKQNLAVTLQSNPAFKAYFTAAIEKMNGSSSVITPSLYDTLTGNSINALLKSNDWKIRAELEEKIDSVLHASKNKSVREYLTNHNTIGLRENLLSQIMNIADGFTFVGSDTQAGYIRNSGVSKEFVDQEAKNKFINDLTNRTISAIAVGAFNPENGIIIPVNFVKDRRSNDGRTLAHVNAWVGAGYNWVNQGILLTLGIGGSIAEQYNYNKVINAQLDDIVAANYVWLEAQVMAGANLAEGNIWVEASGGVEWEKNIATGINQINRQYERTSKYIFSNLEGADLSNEDAIGKALKRNIQNIIDKWGPLQQFISNNEHRLTDNVDFVVNFFKTYKVLDTIPNKDPKAILSLISLLQQGNIEQWRSDILNNKNNKIDITKLSFGVTTNALTASFKKNNSITRANDDKTPTDSWSDIKLPPESPTPGESPDKPLSVSWGTESRFGLAGFYVGMRISNWQTKYHVNDNQLINARSKIQEGTTVEEISIKTPEKYADYLSALFNMKGTDWLGIKSVDGKIAIYNKTNPKISLPKLLNLRVTETAAKQIQYIPNENWQDVLYIGDVWEISASTVARPDGVELRLCLGSNKYKEGKIAPIFRTKENTINTFKPKESGKYQTTTLEDISNLVADKKNDKGEIVSASPFANNPEAQKLFVSCFNEKWQIKVNELPKNITMKNGSLDKIWAGNTIVFKHESWDNYSIYITTWDVGKISLRFVDDNSYINGVHVEFKDTAILSILEIQEKIPEAIRNELSVVWDKDHIKAYGILDDKSGNKEFFRKFMDGTTLDEQKTALLSMLWNDGNLVNTITALKDNNNTTAHQYIVDQFKGIFAYQAHYETYTMGHFVEQRSLLTKNKNFLKAFKIGDSDLQNEIKNIRENMLYSKDNEQLKYNKDNWESVKNLIGFTAFYRGAPQAWLISVGDTKVMKTGKNLDPYTKILEENQEAARDWVSDNLEKHPEERSLLIKWIKDKIHDKLTANELWDVDKNFSTLLTTWTLTLDNWYKKVILKTTPVFYFKAECVNESLGLMIDSIQVQEAPIQDANINKTFIVAWGAYTVAATPNLRQKDVYLKGNVSLEQDKTRTRADDDKTPTDKDTDINLKKHG